MKRALIGAMMVSFLSSVAAKADCELNALAVSAGAGGVAVLSLGTSIAAVATKPPKRVAPGAPLKVAAGGLLVAALSVYVMNEASHYCGRDYLARYNERMRKNHEQSLKESESRGLQSAAANGLN